MQPESLLFLAGHDLAHLKALLPARWYHFLQLKCCLTSSGAQLQAAETYLKEVCGLTHSQAAVVLDSAMAWRYKHGGPTPGEMKLHQACYRNLVRVAEALQQDCGVPPGLFCKHSEAVHACVAAVMCDQAGSALRSQLSVLHPSGLQVRSAKNLIRLLRT